MVKIALLILYVLLMLAIFGPIVGPIVMIIVAAVLNLIGWLTHYRIGFHISWK